MNDLKFACRQLLKNPGFTAVACLCEPHRQAEQTLALGIGVDTERSGPLRYIKGPSLRWQWFGLFYRHDVKRIQYVHETFFSRDDNAPGSEKDKLPVRHGELRPIRRSNLKGHESTLEPLSNVLNRHTLILLALLPTIKTAFKGGTRGHHLIFGCIPETASIMHTDHELSIQPIKPACFAAAVRSTTNSKSRSI